MRFLHLNGPKWIENFINLFSLIDLFISKRIKKQKNKTKQKNTKIKQKQKVKQKKLFGA